MGIPDMVNFLTNKLFLSFSRISNKKIITKSMSKALQEYLSKYKLRDIISNDSRFQIVIVAQASDKVSKVAEVNSVIILIFSY